MKSIIHKLFCALLGHEMILKKDYLYRGVDKEGYLLEQCVKTSMVCKFCGKES